MAAFVTELLNPGNYLGGVRFDPERDIQDLAGKVVLVTGGNAGLGKESILQLAKHNPEKIFLAARSKAKAESAISSLKGQLSNNVNIAWLPLDLTSVQSIKDAAQQFCAQSSRLDILMLNAGVMALPPGETEMGHEIQLGTNHTGHFLLTKLLLPTLLRTAQEPNSDVRVVSLSSIGHNLAPSFETIVDQDKLKRVHTNLRYGASKAANILFAAELARRFPSITSVSVHPGIIFTDLYGPASEFSTVAALSSKLLSIFGTPVRAGAYNQLWAAAGAKKQDLVNGAYYVPVGKLKAHNEYTKNEEQGRRLWDWTEAELHKFGALT
ncbi:dehydrogenase with different specificitie [Aspergillus novofumigatus IBT 16806]|uniref:Dehydrogenase with different specificitie n=1 Tax=Aspergillus novofumigatus (strain IBT 16806) TaxID=1392255 RepID=A0A2I1C0M6_ASPN1|nr:dehydrogenase with different specificitie [Aspergillus novofumigatus IBT 16806]PKX91177.1 dehydrogenase with different specificitie [Aspergillus novofumigatus IBT 16806]